MSADAYVKKLLKISVGQMLQTIGFQTAQSTALEILVEVLERYIFLITRTIHDFSEFGNKLNLIIIIIIIHSVLVQKSLSF